MKLKLRQYQHNDCKILEWQGRVDSFTKSEFEKQLHEAVAEGVLKIAIDMKGIEFIALPTISLLVKTKQKLKLAGGDLFILQPSPNILKHLRVYTGPFELAIFKNFKDFEKGEPLESRVEHSFFE
jgi:anti-anti-sigma factor